MSKRKQEYEKVSFIDSSITRTYGTHAIHNIFNKRDVYTNAFLQLTKFNLKSLQMSIETSNMIGKVGSQNIKRSGYSNKAETCKMIFYTESQLKLHLPYERSVILHILED